MLLGYFGFFLEVPWLEYLGMGLLLLGLICLPIMLFGWLIGITFGFLDALLDALCPGLGRRDLD